MIIKSKGRKGGERSFTTLYNYLCRKSEENFTYFHNFTHSQTHSKEDIINAFKNNAKYIKKSKRLNVLYHELISLKREKNSDLEYYKHILGELAQEYLVKRAPDQIAFCKIHADKDHSIHLHIMLSSNGLQSPKRVRFNKFDYQRIQAHVEEYGRERYPEVIKEAIYTKKGYAKDFDPVKKKKQREIKFQYNKRQAQELKTIKELHDILKQIFSQVKSREELQKALEYYNIHLKERGKNITATYTNEKENTKLQRRLAKLGIDEMYKKMIAEIEKKETYKKQLDNIRKAHKRIDKEYEQEQDFDM